MLPPYHPPSRSSSRSLDITRGLRTDRRTLFFHTKDQSSGIVIADFGMCVAQILSPETCLIRVICLQCQTPRCHRRTAHTRRRKSRICSPRGAEPKAERKACRPWSIGWDCLLSLLIIYGTMEYRLRVAESLLLCGYTPFRADDMKEVIRQTTQARVSFQDRHRKNVSGEVRLGPITAFENVLI